MDPVPDPILPEKFLGYSQESNPGPLGIIIIIITIIVITIIIIIVIIFVVVIVYR